jgi:TolB protein
MKTLKKWITSIVMLAAVFVLLTPATAMRSPVLLEQSYYLPLVMYQLTLEEIAFAGGPDAINLWKVRADGSSLLQLTDLNGYTSSVSWSPDGSSILFDFDYAVGYGEIYTIDADGTNLQQLTNNSVGDWFPSYAPDGDKIVFTSERDSDCEIYTMNTDGSGVTKLTNLDTCPGPPLYSPDGSKIAFQAGFGDLKEIYLMNPDGSGIQQITNNMVYDELWEWSPDGTQLLIASDRFSSSDYHDTLVIDRSGAEVLVLTTGGMGGSAYWSPDGSLIAYWDITDPPYGMYLIHSDGTGKTPILCNSDPFFTWDLDWAPTGDRFAYEISGGGGDGFFIFNINTGSCSFIAHIGHAFGPRWNP